MYLQRLRCKRLRVRVVRATSVSVNVHRCTLACIARLTDGWARVCNYTVFKRTILCLSVCPSLRMFGCARGWRVFVDVCAHDNDIMASCIGTLFYIFTYIHTYRQAYIQFVWLPACTLFHDGFSLVCMDVRKLVCKDKLYDSSSQVGCSWCPTCPAAAG